MIPTTNQWVVSRAEILETPKVAHITPVNVDPLVDKVMFLAEFQLAADRGKKCLTVKFGTVTRYIESASTSNK